MASKAPVVKYSGLIIAFLFLVFEECTTYSSYFKALSGYGQDNNSGKSPFSKTFHQCGMEESCKFVVKNILTKEFTKAKNEDELPKNKEHCIVWQKHVFQRKDCKEISERKSAVSGEYKIWIKEATQISVYCDMKTDGGGWTVIQRRVDGSTDFNRGWEDYKRGFGDINKDFWLGLDAIHTMTAENVHLRVDLVDLDGREVFAKYGKFKVGSEESNYKLEISEYSGNATDAMYSSHNGMRFSTKDRDNDQVASQSCALTYKGGWWYSHCHQANLNGLFTSDPSSRGNPKYLSWFTLNEEHGTIVFSEMKIRRVMQLNDDL